MRTAIDILISWGPMLLLIGVWLYLARKSGGMKQGKYFDQIQTYLSEHIAETKRLNSNLKRIATALEQNPASSTSKSTD